MARTMALGTYEPLSEQIPSLTAAVPADRFNHWSLFWTVAYTWVAFARIGVDVPEGEREMVARIVVEELARSHPSAQPLFDDQSDFIAARAGAISKNVTGTDVALKSVLGLWLVWNLTGKATIPDERLVVSKVGHLSYESVADYWLA